MKLFISNIACMIILLLSMSGIANAQETYTAHPEDTGAALVNPSMGWTMYYYSNVARNYGSKIEPSDTVDEFPGLSTVYLRLPWSYIEPKEGEFNWAILDTPAQRWIAKGKRVVLRLTCSEDWMDYATPKWVKDAGAKGVFYKYSDPGRSPDGVSWDPVYDDPIFLEKLNAFLAAAAKRYDGNPNIEFIDIGTYGLWGEGHTHASSKQDKIELQKLHIDLHLKHFKKTPLCISDDFAGHHKPGKRFPITDYALSKGVTIRDDSIMVGAPPMSWFHDEMAQAFWPTLPVIIETGHYGPSVDRKAWSSELFIKSVEDYHASYMSIHWWPHDFLEKNRDAIDKINMRLGYRLMPTEVTWPKAVRIASTQESYTLAVAGNTSDVTDYGDLSSKFKVQWTWANKGVAPCYPGGFPALTLKDAKGGIVSVLTDETFNMRDLEVGPPEESPTTKHESEFIIGLYAPTTRPGTYDVFISVGKRDGTPTIALPLANDDGQRRYRIGSITIQDN
jgi:hypothetical protein